MRTNSTITLDPHKLKSRRLDADLTQMELANRLYQTSGCTVSRWENAVAPASGLAIIALAHALRCDVSDLTKEV